MSTAAIILAAGQGKRMNSPVKKQYIEIAGRPLLYYPLKAFEDSGTDEIVVVASPEDIDYVKTEVVSRYGFAKVTAVVPGGNERFESVLCGLKATDADYCLIHDGARPLISTQVIERCMAAVIEKKAVVVGVRSKDTVKLVGEDLEVVVTPPRKSVWIAQTPQAFSRELILSAYEKLEASGQSDYIPTDDAMLVQDMTGVKASMLEGEYTNIKVTTPDDLGFVERILNI